jgi:hypothetical protein
MDRLTSVNTYPDSVLGKMESYGESTDAYPTLRTSASLSLMGVSTLPDPSDEQKFRLTITIPQSAHIRSEVSASLERSLEQNADVWAELSNY